MNQLSLPINLVNFSRPPPLKRLNGGRSFYNPVQVPFTVSELKSVIILLLTFIVVREVFLTQTTALVSLLHSSDSHRYLYSANESSTYTNSVGKGGGQGAQQKASHQHIFFLSGALDGGCGEDDGGLVVVW